jgi:hypothetical protein
MMATQVRQPPRVDADTGAIIAHETIGAGKEFTISSPARPNKTLIRVRWMAFW